MSCWPWRAALRILTPPGETFGGPSTCTPSESGYPRSRLMNAPVPQRRDAQIAVAAAFLGFGATYGLNLALSHVLEAHEYGDFSVARAFAFFCSSVVLLGGDRAAPRVLARALQHARFGAAWEYVRFYGAIGWAISAVLIAVVWALGYAHYGDWDPHAQHAVAIMALSIPLMATGALAGRTLQTTGHTVMATMPWRVGAPAALLLALGATYAVRGAVTLEETLWLTCLSIGAIMVVQWVLVRRHALPAVRFERAARQPRDWLALSVPMMSVFLITLGLGESDLYFLEWLGDEREVGHYAAASTTAHLVLTVQTSVVALYAAQLSRDLEEGTPSADAALRRGTRAMAAVLAPLALVLLLGASPILDLFGAGYRDAALPARLLVLGNAAWALAALGALKLQFSGRSMAVLRLTVATLVLDSVLNAALIPSFGMVGAAASSAATSAGAALVVAWMLRERTSPDPT